MGHARTDHLYALLGTSLFTVALFAFNVLPMVQNLLLRFSDDDVPRVNAWLSTPFSPFEERHPPLIFSYTIRFCFARHFAALPLTLDAELFLKQSHVLVLGASVYHSNCSVFALGVLSTQLPFVATKLCTWLRKTTAAHLLWFALASCTIGIQSVMFAVVVTSRRSFRARPDTWFPLVVAFAIHFVLFSVSMFVSMTRVAAPFLRQEDRSRYQA